MGVEAEASAASSSEGSGNTFPPPPPPPDRGKSCDVFFQASQMYQQSCKGFQGCPHLINPTQMENLAVLPHRDTLTSTTPSSPHPSWAVVNSNNNLSQPHNHEHLIDNNTHVDTNGGHKPVGTVQSPWRTRQSSIAVSIAPQAVPTTVHALVHTLL